MEKTTEQFNKIALNTIEKFMRSKGRKYSPEMMRDTTKFLTKAPGKHRQLPASDYTKELIQDFMAENFVPRYETYYRVWITQDKRNFIAYLGRSIDNFLNEKAQKMMPKSAYLWNMLKQTLESMEEEHQVRLFRKNIYPVNKSSDELHGFADPRKLLPTIEQFNSDKKDSLVNTMGDGSVRINKPVFKKLLQKIVEKLDGHMEISELQKLLLSNIVFLEDALLISPGSGGDSEEEGVGNSLLEMNSPESPDANSYIGMKTLLNGLTSRQKRILELKTDTEMTEKQIAEKLSAEGEKCHGATVNREWHKIQTLSEDILQK